MVAFLICLSLVAFQIVSGPLSRAKSFGFKWVFAIFRQCLLRRKRSYWLQFPELSLAVRLSKSGRPLQAN
jgi:hypothetical protein